MSANSGSRSVSTIEIELAKLAQLAQDIERLVGLFQHFWLWPEHDRDIPAQHRLVIRRIELLGTHGHEIEALKIGGSRRSVILAKLIAGLNFSCRIRSSAGAALGADSRAATASPDRDIPIRSESTSFACNSVSTISCVLANLPPRMRVEHRFENMRELDEIFETKNPGAALHRVNGAKHRIYGVFRAPCPSRMSDRPSSICCSASLHSSKNVTSIDPSLPWAALLAHDGARLRSNLVDGRDQPCPDRTA